MKIISLLTVVFILGAFIFLAACGTKKNPKQIQDMPKGDTPRVVQPATNVYNDMRNMALNTTAEKLQLSLPKNALKVFGVVMDWDLGEGIATLVSFETGDASMYLSTGGGTIGGIGHKNVVHAAKEFVAKAGGYINEAIKVDSTPLPDKNCVRFYLLTNKGIFSAQDEMKNLEDNSSVWLAFFEEANKVITELRIITEKTM
jgi:hypothetical protein